MQDLTPSSPAATFRPAGNLHALVNAYTFELAARRSQLLEDSAIFGEKLDCLKRLDPLDFTGLQELYRAHLRQIDQLLTEFDDSGE